MQTTNETNPNRYIGALVISLFGAYWVAAWTVLIFGYSLPILSLVIGLMLLLSIVSIHKWLVARSGFEQSKTGEVFKSSHRKFWVVVAVEGVLISLLVQKLRTLGYYQWIPAGIIFIVGLHFLPLSIIFRFRFYLYTGVVLILTAIAFPLMSPQGPASVNMLLCSGLVLWGTSLRILV